MLSIFIIITVIFLVNFVLGHFLEKLHIPWIFSSILLGLFVALIPSLRSIASDNILMFLANLGMYFLLFVIGFEIDLDDFKKKTWFIVRGTFVIVLLEGLLGSILLHFVFGQSWFISMVLALSFATVGETVLLPILDEFKLVKTKLGELLIGIGTLDDIIEISLLVLIAAVLGIRSSSFEAMKVIGSLIALFVLTVSLIVVRKRGIMFKFFDVESMFLFVMGCLFLFLAVGEAAFAAPLGALLAGIVVKNFIPKNRIKLVEKEVRAVCYGLFAPLFFFFVGASLDFTYVLAAPLLVFAVIIVSSLAKLLGSFLIGHKELGFKQSLLLGVGLSVRFSTSIVIVKILLDRGFIGNELYSVIVASSMVFILIIPILFAILTKVVFDGKRRIIAKTG